MAILHLIISVALRILRLETDGQGFAAEIHYPMRRGILSADVWPPLYLFRCEVIAHYVCAAGAGLQDDLAPWLSVPRSVPIDRVAAHRCLPRYLLAILNLRLEATENSANSHLLVAGVFVLYK